MNKKRKKIILTSLLSFVLLINMCGLSALASTEDVAPRGIELIGAVSTENELVYEVMNITISEPITLPEIASFSESQESANVEEFPEDSEYTITIHPLEIEDIQLSSDDSNHDDLAELENAEVQTGNSADSHEISPFATLADLEVSNLRTDAPKPLPTYTAVPFKFNVSNIGGTAANNIYMSIYVNGSLIASPSNIGSLPANYTGAVGGFDFGTMSAGAHTIKVVLNEGKSIAESNYNNNSTSASFTFTETTAVDVSAYSIYSDSGTSFPCHTKSSGDTERFSYVVANFGPNTAKNVPIRIFFMGNKISGNTDPVIASIPSSTGAVVTVDLSLYVSATYAMELYVDPDKKLNDVDRTDNYKKENFQVTYDREVYGGKWPLNTTLNSYIVNNDVLNYTTTSAITTNSRLWNGKGGSITIGNLVSSESQANVLIGTYTTDKSGEVAHAWVSPGWTSTYTKGYFEVNTNYHGGSTPARTITHEYGHILGLEHPDCNNPAIMKQLADPYHTDTIQQHDIYNLKLLY